MQVYFAASIAGGRSFLPTYQNMVRHLQSQGHQVLTEHIIAADVLASESRLTPGQIYRRDIEWLERSDAVVAEISNPSLGVGYEIGYALDLDKKILCLHRRGLFISRMIIGNDRPGLTIAEYESDEEWQREIGRFLSAV